MFLFFGLVAVVGTAYLQALRLDPVFLAASVPPGALITAILVVNNLRDIPTDTAAGKRTLAVVLGERRTRGRVRGAARHRLRDPGDARARMGRWGRVPAGEPWALAFLVLLPLLTVPSTRPLLRTVASFGERRELNLVLKGTARLSLVFGLLFAAGLALGGGFAP